MDAGLITQHNLRNFGSDLQAFSLYACLNELGAKTSVINYWLPELRHIYNSKYDWKVDGLSKLPRRILGNLARLANARNIEKSRERFAQFRNGWRFTREYVGEDAINRDPPVFDAYVAGSDAIWSVTRCSVRSTRARVTCVICRTSTAVLAAMFRMRSC